MQEIKLEKFLENKSIEIALVVATSIELESALKLLNEYEDDLGVYKIQEGEFTYYCGLFGVYSSVLVKANTMATMQLGASLQTTTSVIEKFHPKAVIMGGIAFGKNPDNQKFGDLLLSDSIITYNPSRLNKNGSTDYRGSKPNTNQTIFNRFSQNRIFTFMFNGEQQEVNIHTGPILTGEVLVDNKEFRDNLFAVFPDAIGGEMEGTGVYAACQTKNIPWIVVKAICDWADGYKDKKQQEFAAFASFSFIFERLKSNLIFESLGISPYVTSEAENTEINFDAIDILKLIVPQRDMHKVTNNLGTRNRISRVYYEYYSYSDNGRKKGFMFLGNNIRLNKVFEDFKNQQQNNMPNTLEIFLAKKKNVIDRKKGINDRIKSLGLENIVGRNIHYIDDFIWESTYLTNNIDSHKRQDFIDQTLYLLDRKNNQTYDVGASLPYFVNDLQNESTPITIVLGSGGVGKTTFCDTLQYTIQQKDIKKKVFYIKGEKVVNFFIKGPEQRIESLEDLYELYKEETDFEEIAKENFRLNFIAGNILVIIDAIEEIESALNERFNLQSFFDSLNELHKRFYSTKIILTTREHFLPKIEVLKDISEIKYFALQGFKRDNLDAFLQKRYPNDISKTSQVNKFLNQNNLMTKEGYIIPLFVDWVCQIVDRPEGQTTLETDYFVPSRPMDKLLMNLLDREITKQSLNVDIDGMFKLLEDIIVHRPGEISKKDLAEYITVELNGDIDNFVKNPLFIDKKDSISIKYDILHNFIKARYLRHILLNKHNVSEQVISLLKDMYIGKSDLFSELKEILFLTEDTSIEIFSYFLQVLTSKYDQENREINKENIRKSISGLLYLFMSQNIGKDQNETTELLLKIYNNNHILNNLFIYGDFYPINLSNIKVKESLLDGYTNLIKCNFPTTEDILFYYVTFRNIELPANKKIKKAYFDSSCVFQNTNLNDITNHEEESNQKMIEQNRRDIISLTKYIETSKKSENLIKRHCNIKYSKGEKRFLQRLIGIGYIESLANDLYKITSNYYDQIPSIKLGVFPQEIEDSLISL